MWSKNAFHVGVLYLTPPGETARRPDMGNQVLQDILETVNSSAQDCHTCITLLQWFATKDTSIQYNIVSSKITMFAAIQYPSLP